LSLKLKKKSSIFEGEISIKGSKSLSNRLLIIRDLSKSDGAISNLSESDDTKSMAQYVNMITTCEISGVPMVIDAGNAGTVARFLAAFMIYREGTWLLTGDSRMKTRPIKGLVGGLRQLGANIEYIDQDGYLPVKIIGEDIRGGEITVDASKSSQFISAIMMIGPYLEDGLIINIAGDVVSFSYILMTQKLMQRFGISVSITDKKIIIKNGKYCFHQCTVEPDWSSVSYWYETVALSEKSSIFIPGLKRNSLQGDSILPQIYEQFGVETKYYIDGIRISRSGKAVDRFSYDFKEYPDIVPAIMATCAGLGIDAEFSNIDHLRYKESNRLEALTIELGKIGVSIWKRNENYFLTKKSDSAKDLVFNTHNDHRIAMCLAPLVLKFINIKINNPEVVNKSYREFWDDFKKLNFAKIN
jgi:3-phosphoshikimate 1-carboxyvinyltransferase